MNAVAPDTLAEKLAKALRDLIDHADRAPCPHPVCTSTGCAIMRAERALATYEAAK